MSNENANFQDSTALLQSQEFFASFALALMPALSNAVDEAIQKAVLLNASPTMSKEDFCNANKISSSVLEKWIREGVVLLAPTPTSTVTRKVTCRKTGKERTDVMEKHGNALINVAAWRERNRQHALKCRYIKP